MMRITFVTVLALAVSLSSSLRAQEKELEPPVRTKAAQKSKQDGQRKWQVLFDGKQMKQWQAVKGIDYEDGGKIEVKSGNLVIGTGQPATGVRWSGKFPKVNYVVELEGQRVDGNDFFCGMSFPVEDGALTLVLGGWGGWVVGLSCIDSYRAIENETCSSIEFKNGQWYKIRVTVTQDKVTAFVDNKMICELETPGRKLNVTYEMEPCLPFGFATWNTTGALRNIRYRPLSAKELSKQDDRP